MSDKPEMKTFDDGGRAFPDEYGSGMSLWAWFAGQALAGELANPADGFTADETASRCAIFATAMVAEMRRMERGV